MFGRSSPRVPYPGRRVFRSAPPLGHRPHPVRQLHSPARHRLRRFLVRHRRLLAGLLVSAACGIAVQAYLPPDPHTARQVVAAGDLPAGHVLEAADLRLAPFPSAAIVPGSFTDPTAAAGTRLAVPLRAGTVLTDSVLVGPGLLAGTPEGTVAVPLRTADPASAGLLSPGDVVDVLLASQPGFGGTPETSVLAAGVPVLWIAGGASGGTAARHTPGWPAAEQEDAGLVVVAARGAEAAVLAGAAERGNVYLVLSGS